MSARKILAAVFVTFLVCGSGNTATIKYYTTTIPWLSWTWKSAAVRFTVPSDASYRLDSISICLHGDPSSTLLDVTIWEDVGGSRGSVLGVLPDQSWVAYPTHWNQYDLSSLGLVFAPGTSFFAGYTSDASEYGDVGVFLDPSVNLGRSSGINIHYGPDWQDIDKELLFKAEVAPVPATLQVQIDIKPGSDANAINLASEGVVPVAILGCDTLDVHDIDQASLQMAGNTAREKGKSGKIGSFEDINDDGYADLLVQFPTEGLDLTESDTAATIDGQLTDGTPITGTDSIKVVPRE